MRHLCLTIAGGAVQCEALDIMGRGRVLIGRSEGCSLRLTDPLVSRRHCLIEVDEDGARLRDLGSLNGTFLNGRPAGGKREKETGISPLHDGDELRLGGSVLHVELETDESKEGEPEWYQGLA